MMFGGDVKGRQIVGSYPGNLTDDGELSLGRGRMIATTSWDAVFLPLAEWAGVEESNLDNVCPNRGNFPASHFIDTADLFEFNTPSPTISNSPTMSSIPTAMPVTTAPTKHPVTQAPTTSSPTIPVTSSPTSTPPSSVAPTSTSPSKSPTTAPTLYSLCSRTRKVKIELLSGEDLNFIEVQVYSSGNEIATNKVASQSSTLKDNAPKFGAGRAVDGLMNTFSHTQAQSGPVWWEVDLGVEHLIDSVTIMNRWCQDISDPNGCLCRLSSATIILINGQEEVIATQSVGEDTCGQVELSFDFSCIPSPSATLSPVASPTVSQCTSDTHEARKVKIELSSGEDLNLIEVQVYSSGNEIATNKVASQSSTLKDNAPKFGAGRAVDGLMNTFSHTQAQSGPVWWEVDLGVEHLIDSVTIMNRWCQDISDPNGCLCRLSSATIILINGQEEVIATQSVGEDTCGQAELSFDFTCPN